MPAAGLTSSNRGLQPLPSVASTCVAGVTDPVPNRLSRGPATTDLAAVPQLRDSLELAGPDREAAMTVVSGLRDAKPDNTRRACASTWRCCREWAEASGLFQPTLK